MAENGVTGRGMSSEKRRDDAEQQEEREITARLPSRLFNKPVL